MFASYWGVTRNDMINQELQVSQHVKDETLEEGNHPYLPRSLHFYWLQVHSLLAPAGK